MIEKAFLLGICDSINQSKIVPVRVRRMCWNEDVSIGTYLGVVGVALAILMTKPRPNIVWQCVFSSTFVFVQLLEAILWVSIRRHDAELNDLITRVVLLVLWTQPLVNSLGGLLTEGTRWKNGLRFAVALFAFILCWNLMVVASQGIVSSQDSINFISVKSRGCHLIWTRSDIPYFMSSSPVILLFYYGGLLVPLTLMRPVRDAIVFGTSGALGLAFSVVFFKRDGSFSSMWCFLSIFYVATILGLHVCNRCEDKAKRS
jgi:hypothetical protein